ncbi:hypothetical protein F7725_015172 [Dissostichus mawsoni]|uniref:Uncharacterized protein n=1 Tax=Dissostichus mawsoni TaxID=36200 RepID=A0A7J5YGU6_DISMA|nr:hypothetical protein F7725_015172 [Dissostichus mawsoni]
MDLVFNFPSCPLLQIDLDEDKPRGGEGEGCSGGALFIVETVRTEAGVAGGSILAFVVHTAVEFHITEVSSPGKFSWLFVRTVTGVGGPAVFTPASILTRLALTLINIHLTVPPFWHGSDSHSSMFTEQFSPVIFSHLRTLAGTGRCIQLRLQSSDPSPDPSETGRSARNTRQRFHTAAQHTHRIHLTVWSLGSDKHSFTSSSHVFPSKPGAQRHSKPSSQQTRAIVPAGFIDAVGHVCPAVLSSEAFRTSAEVSVQLVHTQGLGLRAGVTLTLVHLLCAVITCHTIRADAVILCFPRGAGAVSTWSEGAGVIQFFAVFAHVSNTVFGTDTGVVVHVVHTEQVLKISLDISMDRQVPVKI